MESDLNLVYQNPELGPVLGQLDDLGEALTPEPGLPHLLFHSIKMEGWGGVWHAAKRHPNVCSFLPGLGSSKGNTPVGVSHTALGDHHQIVGAAETELPA